MSSVTNSLNDIFKKHRLVFWYDPEGEMREEYADYSEDGVTKVEVQNDEFGLDIFQRHDMSPFSLAGKVQEERQCKALR